MLAVRPPNWRAPRASPSPNFTQTQHTGNTAHTNLCYFGAATHFNNPTIRLSRSAGVIPVASSAVEKGPYARSRGTATLAGNDADRRETRRSGQSALWHAR